MKVCGLFHFLIESLLHSMKSSAVWGLLFERLCLSFPRVSSELLSLLRWPCWISSSECWCRLVFTPRLTSPRCPPNSPLPFPTSTVSSTTWKQVRRINVFTLRGVKKIKTKQNFFRTNCFTRLLGISMSVGVSSLRLLSTVEVGS